jgi:hypothetical protein
MAETWIKASRVGRETGGSAHQRFSLRGSDREMLGGTYVAGAKARHPVLAESADG